MARSNGPFGPPEARPPLRRRPGNDALAALPQPAGQWPAQGFPDHGQAHQAGPAYHFPPPEQAPSYGYNQQAHAPQQWQGDQPGYDLANYLPADPPPFQHTSHHQQQAYGEADADYGEEYFEDEEPRHGRRWILIAAALVGAIGVGGALAYTYRSFIAPNTGRVPLVKAEPNVKVKPEHRGGKEFPGTERKLPNRLGDGASKAEPEPEAQAEPAGEEKNLGPRPVKTIAIGARPGQVAPPAPVTVVPGITLQNLQPPPAQVPAEEAQQPPPTARASIGQKPAAEADDDPAPAPAVKRPPVVQTPPVAVAKATPARTREPAPAPGAGIGYVAVVSSQKTHIDAVKAYADAVEKHPQVLSGRTPDVQEANLGEKGIWYRAVVGPPGSREAAMSLCTQLKAAGHGCWVKEY